MPRIARSLLISGSGGRPRRRGGFTLVEVMVAIAILAVGITAALRAVSTSTHASALARDRMTAAMLAQQAMNELIQNGNVTEGTDSGDFGTQFNGYHWESDVEDSSDYSGLYQINVVVSWPNGTSNESHYNLTTLYLPPDTFGNTSDNNAGGNLGLTQ
jgi:general secretion pathway protein I